MVQVDGEYEVLCYFERLGNAESLTTKRTSNDAVCGRDRSLMFAYEEIERHDLALSISCEAFGTSEINQTESARLGYG